MNGKKLSVSERDGQALSVTCTGSPRAQATDGSSAPHYFGNDPRPPRASWCNSGAGIRAPSSERSVRLV